MENEKLKLEINIFNKLNFYAELILLFESTDSITKREVQKRLDFYKNESINILGNKIGNPCTNETTDQ